MEETREGKKVGKAREGNEGGEDGEDGDEGIERQRSKVSGNGRTQKGKKRREKNESKGN